MPGSPEGGFEIVDHTADTAIRGWGSTPEELFVNMAKGLFKVIGGEATVSSTKTRALDVEAENPNELLHDWLETLNALHQIHHELYTGFELSIDENLLKATVRGGPMAGGAGEFGIEVKAVTWHDLNIRETPHGLEAYVLLDI
jgi:SHS2 domain-containing protein